MAAFFVYLYVFSNKQKATPCAILFAFNLILGPGKYDSPAHHGSRGVGGGRGGSGWGWELGVGGWY